MLLLFGCLWSWCQVFTQLTAEVVLKQEVVVELDLVPGYRGLAAGARCARCPSVSRAAAGLCFADWAAVLTPHLQPENSWRS